MGVNTQHFIEEPILQFASDVGSVGPVTVVGGRTQWDVGGLPLRSSREVRAPSGVWSHEPEEMTVRCGAGTSIRELNEKCAQFGQMEPFDLNPRFGARMWNPEPGRFHRQGVLRFENEMRELRYL